MALRRSQLSRALALVVLCIGTSGCGLASRLGGSARSRSGNASELEAGEAPGTIPAGAQQQGAVREPLSTPEAAIARFAGLYINWSYRTLAANERELAAFATGAARSSELQAAAQSGADSTIAHGHLHNSGTVVAIAPMIGSGSMRYVVVSEEQTGGQALYEGLPSAFHVTLATVAALRRGYAVSAWEPES